MNNNEKNNQNNIESLYEQKNNIEQTKTSKKLSLFSKIIFVILFINAIFLVPFAVKFWFLWLMFGGLGGDLEYSQKIFDNTYFYIIISLVFFLVFLKKNIIKNKFFSSFITVITTVIVILAIFFKVFIYIFPKISNRLLF